MGHRKRSTSMRWAASPSAASDMRTRRSPRPLCDQAGKLVHTSNLYEIPLQEQLADRLCDCRGMDRVFFCNSGAEANEAAIKLARLYGHSGYYQRPPSSSRKTASTAAPWPRCPPPATARIQAGFEPLVQGFIRVPYNDLEAIRTIASNNERCRRGAGRTDPGRRRYQYPGRGLPDGGPRTCVTSMAG